LIDGLFYARCRWLFPHKVDTHETPSLSARLEQYRAPADFQHHIAVAALRGSITTIALLVIIKGTLQSRAWAEDAFALVKPEEAHGQAPASLGVREMCDGEE